MSKTRETSERHRRTLLHGLLGLLGPLVSLFVALLGPFLEDGNVPLALPAGRVLLRRDRRVSEGYTSQRPGSI